MIDFSTLQSLTIPEGVVTQIADASGRVLWSSGKPAVLRVEKITVDTYASETQYSDESCVLLDIYPKTGSSKVEVTYGGLTKTLTFSGTNAQKVFFGTFYGETDSVTTPASGELTIKGDYMGFAVGSYNSYNTTTSKSVTKYCSCITDVVDWGSTESIGNYAFYGCSNIALTSLPSGVTSIGNYAFYGCSNIALTSLPSGVTSIGAYAFYECAKLNISEIPHGVTAILDFSFAIGKFSKIGSTIVENKSEGVAMHNGTMLLPSTLSSIGQYAFSYATSQSTTDTYVECTYLSSIRCLATTPPRANIAPFGDTGNYSQLLEVQVPQGCGDIYKAAENWRTYAYLIVEAS